MTAAVVAGIRADLSAWPGSVLELDADGRIEASNGRLDSLVSRAVVGLRLADLVDDESSGGKLRRMTSERTNGGVARWELVLRGPRGLLEPRPFTFLSGRERGGGWLVEHPVDARLERLTGEVATVNSDLVVTQRALLKEQQRLAAALSELERSNAALDEFAHVVSHDLKAPLRSIADYAELLGDARSRLTGDEPLYVERLGALSRKMGAMIDGVLAYARAGRASSRAQMADSGEILREVVELCAPPGDARIELATDLPTFELERVPFEQVFRNLISNAIRYRAERPLHVRISAADSGTQWEFVVADNGIGIPRSQQDRIWRLFHTSRPGEGTGIGLAVVKRIVESQGGRIFVESEPGDGATFHVFWPKHAPSSARARP